MRENIAFKVASVVLAVTLWVFVIARGYSEVSVPAPVEFENVPVGMRVVQIEPPAHVVVSVRGHERVLKGMDSSAVRIKIDLNGISSGSHRIAIDKEDVRLPLFVSLINVVPHSMDISVEEVSKKAVPVRPDVVGEPRDGYRVMRMKVTPGSVTVSGGKSQVKNLSSVRTEPIDISGASARVSSSAKVVPPGAGLASEPESVTVEIAIERGR